MFKYMIMIVFSIFLFLVFSCFFMLVDKFCRNETITTLDDETNELNRIEFLYFMLACFKKIHLNNTSRQINACIYLKLTT